MRKLGTIKFEAMDLRIIQLRTVDPGTMPLQTMELEAIGFDTIE